METTSQQTDWRAQWFRQAWLMRRSMCVVLKYKGNSAAPKPTRATKSKLSLPMKTCVLCLCLGMTTFIDIVISHMQVVCMIYSLFTVWWAVIYWANINVNINSGVAHEVWPLKCVIGVLICRTYHMFPYFREKYYNKW